MTNRDLLKEAIADAKAVKETAIANAKAALEESFTPHLKSMLAAKLEEMDNDEDIEETITTEEVESVDEVIEEVEDVKNVEEEINLDEILAELEESEEVTEAEEDEDVEDVEDEEAEEATEEEEIDLEDMSEDDLKSFIEDVIKDMVDAGELEGGEEMESEEEAEGAEMEDEMDIEIEDDAEEIMENEEVEEGYGDRADAAGGGLEVIVKGLQDLYKKGGPIAKKAYAALQDLGAAAGSAMRNEEELEEDDAVSKKLKDGASLDSAPRKVGQTTVQEEEIDETLSEIEDLKKELQEVNLLNAKLLYTNKIFKAKNLSEDKKVKVLKAFDKAETVKEAKVIFETLNEGMVAKKSTNSMVNEVKGSASKAMGISQTTKQPIVENDAFARMQKLAGIIK